VALRYSEGGDDHGCEAPATCDRDIDCPVSQMCVLGICRYALGRCLAR
jgi:hypothetical protein